MSLRFSANTIIAGSGEYIDIKPLNSTDPMIRIGTNNLLTMGTSLTRQSWEAGYVLVATEALGAADAYVTIKNSDTSTASRDAGIQILANASSSSALWLGRNTSQAAATYNGFQMVHSTGTLRWHNEGSVVAAMDSSGVFMVGKEVRDSGVTSGFEVYQSGTMYVTRVAGPSAIFRRTTNIGTVISFQYGSTGVGSIYTDGSTTSYFTSSDYRLKENVEPINDALVKVLQLKPVTYTWSESGIEGEGFIAHELQEVCPLAVSGTKDGIDEEGNPEYQSVDTSKIVALLTKAIQELNVKIETQQQQINSLLKV